MLYEREQFFVRECVISLYLVVTITPETQLIYQKDLLSLIFWELFLLLLKLVTA